MNYDAIRSMLLARLKAVVTDLPTLQAENTRITPGTAKPWSRMSLLPAQPTALTVGPNGIDEHQGLVQVDLFYPQGTGTSTVSAMATKVMGAFPRGLIALWNTENVHVRMSSQQTAYQVDQWYVVPVVVRWVSYSQPNPTPTLSFPANTMFYDGSPILFDTTYVVYS